MTSNLIHNIETVFYSTQTDVLKSLVGLNKSVILEADQSYSKWLDFLGPDNNAAAAKAIFDYATTNGARGVMLTGISPVYVSQYHCSLSVEYI